MSYTTEIEFRDRTVRYEELLKQKERLANLVSRWETERSALASITPESDGLTEISTARTAFLQQIRTIFGF